MVRSMVGAGAAACLAFALCTSSQAGILPFMPEAAVSSAVPADKATVLTPDVLNARLQAAQRQLDTLIEESDASAVVARKRFLLQWQINTLREHLALLRASEVEQMALDSMKPETSGAAISGNKSWRIDHLRAELQWRADEVRKRESDIRVLDQLIDAGRRRADEKAKSRRLLEDKLSRNPPTAEQTRLLQERDLSLLSQQTSATLLDLQEAKKKVQEQRLQLARKAMQDSENLLQKQGVDHTIDAADLAQILKLNAKRAEQLEQQMGVQSHVVDSLRGQLVKLTEQDHADDRKLAPLIEARDTLQRETEPSPRLAQINGEIDKLQAAQAQRQADRKQILLQVRTSEIAVDMLGVMLNALAMERAFWERRASSDDTQDLNSNNFKAAISQFDSYETLVRSDLELVQSQLARALLQAEPESGSTAAPADSLQQQDPTTAEFRKRQQYYTDTLSTLMQIRRMLERRMDDFDVNAHELTGTARLDYWRTELLADAAAIWNFELFNVDDKLEIDGQVLTIKRGVTVGKVIAAILLVTLGGWLASRLMRIVERLAIRRVGMQPTSARIARRWLFVLVMLVLVTWSLTLVRIPLTAFAFMGGAVAIGVGFGTQNLLKNLISGLMIMGERPMRPGDWIEVGALQGEVTDINLRATIIRDINGIETLIPNSTFVEQNVTNWTLSNRMVRRGVQVGVAYGSPTRKVAELLEAAVQRHGVICQTPPPEVLFENFGDSALMFGVYFWLEMRPGVSGRQVLSDLRYMIDKSFAEHGIVIAFPQHDVHLDTSRPLVVQLDRLQRAAQHSPGAAT